MKKKPVHIIVIFLILLVSLILCTGFCFADSTDRPLAADLNDVRTYEIAEKIASEAQATRDVTYTTDDIYNLLTSVRTYVNSAYNIRVYDSAVLGALQDLNGYNTAYNTHSMLVDLWSKLGGNENYSLYNFVKDINSCLEISNGNESYNVTELLAGIYNISATPKSLYDIWSKIGDVANYSDNTTSMLGYIYNDISSIKSIIASADVLQAKQDQQEYEDDALTNFTGSGSAAASRSDQGNIKDTSRALKSGLDSGGSVSNSLGVFNTTNNSLWDWFTEPVMNSLDTVPSSNTVIFQEVFTPATNSARTFTLNNYIPANTNLIVSLECESGISTCNVLFQKDNNTVQTIGNITSGTTSFSNQFITQGEGNQIRFTYLTRGREYTLTVYSVSNSRSNLSDKIVNFIIPNINDIKEGLNNGKSSIERR